MTTPKPALPEPDGYFYEVDGYFGIHRQFDTAPYNGMRPHRTVGYFTADTTRAAIDAAVAEARAVPALTFDAFRAANVARCVKWHPEGIASWSPSDWLTAVTGELGELASLLKMRNRERDGLPGNKFSPTQKQIADELADVLTYLDLLAEVLGVDLGRAAVEKFNEVSERVGFSDRIAIIATPSPAEQPKPAVVDLPDSIRVPLHRLWADAGYLIGRAKNGETDLAVHTIKALCDELERAIRAALQGEPHDQA